MNKAKVISFINMKGGVGKTTTCMNIAYTLVKEFKKNVLLIDMDPQFNATQALFTKFSNFGIYEQLQKENKTISHILTPPRGGITKQSSSHELEEIIIQLFSLEEAVLDMIPGDLELISFESSRRGSEKILQNFIDTEIREHFNYDYILIDTPATYSIYSQSSLIASDYYCVPIAPDVFSALGYSLLQRVMGDDLTLSSESVKNLGIVFTLWKNTAGRESIQEKFHGEPKFESVISEFERVRTGRLETFIYDMTTSREEIINLTREFIDKAQ
ncbi:AAA family ATPase [Fictibacillus sp. 7GRE50]|uniref:ParA family protein n=1 Tax=Fictibacillus sp. 7GRE50 TaxID=2745878 RepID=UPI0018CE7FB0|nr:AAA family ATPase [Fictibacillus sp. 7GRE50]MBH0167568.1 AAA family ATPase [Fictibacillus sp. 7GRE50]